ncbi:MAG: tetratricopeptide repeat protein [Microscillaceae bacterium]|nr:tetratricopeptide repeat protein [Microscillaceae bacterium]
MAQVSELNAPGDVNKTMRYYRRLLNDEKNIEFQDKIYYEMGVYALRRQQMPEAIGYFRQSLAVSQNNLQKAYTYLKLGEIHYQPLKKYEQAKVYYDSVMAALPENAENYKAISRRHKALEEFVIQLNIYRTEDSLQRLYQMAEPAREAYITQSLTWEETRRQDELDSLAEQKRRLEALKKQSAGTLASLDNSQWYFYNPTSVRLGQESFQERWGRRPLVDNWRRTEAIRGIVIRDTVKAVYQDFDPAVFRQQEIQKRVERRKAGIYEALPKNEGDIRVSNQKIEDAAYELGRIYRFKLEEPDNAIVYFEILLNRFPQTAYKPEVLYFLHVLYGERPDPGQAEHYKNLLVRQFPNSIYAKRLLNPNWEKEALANEAEVKAAYKRAYTLYENRQYPEALATVQKLQQDYPGNLIEDKVAFLNILIDIKMLIDRKVVLDLLQNFLNKYPGSQLSPRAESLLAKLK